jgi:hypothetical protein
MCLAPEDGIERFDVPEGIDWSHKLSLSTVYITLDNGQTITQESTNDGTFLCWLLVAVGIVNEDLCNGLRTSDQQTIAVENTAIRDQSIVGHLGHPLEIEAANGLAMGCDALADEWQFTLCFVSVSSTLVHYA